MHTKRNVIIKVNSKISFLVILAFAILL